VLNLGLWVGNASVGWFADRFGLRRSIATYLTLGAIVLLSFSYLQSTAAILIGLGTVGVMQGGFLGLYAVGARIYPATNRDDGNRLGGRRRPARRRARDRISRVCSSRAARDGRHVPGFRVARSRSPQIAVQQCARPELCRTGARQRRQNAGVSKHEEREDVEAPDQHREHEHDLAVRAELANVAESMPRPRPVLLIVRRDAPNAVTDPSVHHRDDHERREDRDVEHEKAADALDDRVGHDLAVDA
jgi:hypothetical protein